MLEGPETAHLPGEPHQSSREAGAGQRVPGHEAWQWPGLAPPARPQWGSGPGPRSSGLGLFCGGGLSQKVGEGIAPHFRGSSSRCQAASNEGQEPGAGGAEPG